MTNSIFCHLSTLTGVLAYTVFALPTTHAEPDAQTPPKANLKQLALKKASHFTQHIGQSRSPNKKFTVAVGTRDGTKPKWEKVPYEQEDGSKKMSYSLDGDNIANYLIDTTTDRVVAVLHGQHFGTLNRYNHESASYAWSADSRWLAETQDWKWNTGTCTVHHLSPEGKSLGHLDLLLAATKLVDSWLQKHAPKLTADDRSGYAVSTTVKSIANDGKLTAKIFAEVPKDENSKYVQLSVTAIITKKEGKLSLKVTSIKPIKQ